jgi:hypothetical protein
MEYKILTPQDSNYPRKLIERLGNKAPEKIYYYGPLEFLDRWTMAVLCSQEAGGTILLEMNQVLFTVREYDINYIGSWHSGMESEIFRLGLYKKFEYNSVTLFTAKGLGIETYEEYLLDRFYPPFDKIPERDEYLRRAKEGELLILSVSPPEETRQKHRNIMLRNWIACALGDLVFIPFGPKGSKTYTTAKKVVEAKIPIFTIDHEISVDLHHLGVPGFNRKTVGAFLEKMGAKKYVPNTTPKTIIPPPEITTYKPQKPIQTELNFVKEGRKRQKN